MKPGMKMMVMDRMRQQTNNRSEYGGGGRRMIGFESNRNEGGSRNYAENRMEGGGGSNYAENRMENRIEGSGYSNYGGNNRMEYGGGGSSNYGGNRMEYGMENMENRRRRDSRGRYMEGEGYQGNRGYGRSETESRRRRDSRGRYMMGGMDDDDDDEEMASQTWFPPYGWMPPNMHGGYGDIYTEGMIYAPGAQNRPGMMGMEQEWSKPVDEHTARKWVEKMDGGEHFKMEQAEQLRMGHCQDCDKIEFYVALNSMYSDFCEVAQKLGVDRTDFYALMAKAFLKDKDAGPHKLRKYMETIPK